VCFFGDGAANQGTFHESLNLAALWKLPVLYVCENNQYALSTPLLESVGLPELSERARGYGIPGVRVDGNDVLAVHAAAGEAVRRARAGEGPTLLDCLTYRFFGHFTGDKGHGITYRTKQEMEEWRARCPIVRFRRHLLQTGVAAEARLVEIEAQAEAAIAAAAQYGLDSPWPASEEAVEDVFA
jgi:TPP-dependent pyruvate/acetoin dehydrogenase alpha subunit